MLQLVLSCCMLLGVVAQNRRVVRGIACFLLLLLTPFTQYFLPLCLHKYIKGRLRSCQNPVKHLGRRFFVKIVNAPSQMFDKVLNTPCGGLYWALQWDSSIGLTHLKLGPLHRNQSMDLHIKLIDWFLCERYIGLKYIKLLCHVHSFFSD